MTDLTSYRAMALANAKYILGDVVWHSICQLLAPRDELVKLAKSCGLSEDDVPTSPAITDAFRRATSKVQHKGNNGIYTWLVRPVRDRGEKGIVRHIIRERRDEHGEMLDYEKVGELLFDGVGKFRSVINDHSDTHVAKMCADAEAAYQAHCVSLDENDVRRMVKRCMDAMAPCSVHPMGRVHFVPHFHHDRLESLSKFVHSLDKYATGQGRTERAVFAIVPLPDVPEQRDMVAEGFKSGLNSAIEAAVADLAEVLQRDGKPADTLADSKAVQLAEFEEQLATYKNLLSIQIDEAEIGLDFLRDQVKQLLGLANETVADSDIMKQAIEYVGKDRVRLETKAHYTTVFVDDCAVGRCRYNRNGITMQVDDAVGKVFAEVLGDYDELSKAGNSGYKVQTNDGKVLGLFLSVDGIHRRNKRRSAGRSKGTSKKVVRLMD